MTTILWDDFIQQDHLRDAPCAVSIGVFDGVHLGHRRLLELVEGHRDATLRGVITFRENPSRYVHGDTYGGDILTLRQRLERLDALGVDLVVLIDFTEAFRELPGKRFLDLVRRAVDLRYVTVGWNFHCGRNSDTNAAGVAEYLGGNGVRVDIASAVLDNNVPVSSTRIRRAILRGDLGEAERLMVEPWGIDARESSVVCNGAACFVRREEVRQVLPPAGFYRRTLLLDSGAQRNQFEVARDGIHWEEQVATTTAH
ncbi:MAG: FAD synthetase family protein [Spirochaetaceae bacterium]